MILMTEATHSGKFWIQCVQTVRGDEEMLRNAWNVMWSRLDRPWGQKLSKGHITVSCIKSTRNRSNTNRHGRGGWIVPSVPKFGFLSEKRIIQHVWSSESRWIDKKHVLKARDFTIERIFYKLWLILVCPSSTYVNPIIFWVSSDSV